MWNKNKINQEKRLKRLYKKKKVNNIEKMREWELKDMRINKIHI